MEMNAARATRWLGVSSVLALACGAPDPDPIGTQTASLQSVVHLVPAYDISGGNAIVDGENDWYANVDDGTAFESADDSATSVRTARRRLNANFAVALS